METDVTKTCRVFKLTGISEKEGLVLRTLLNLNEKGVRDRLLGDKHYWSPEIKLGEAVAIGRNLCDSILCLIDG